MTRPRTTLQRRLRLLIGGVGLVLVLVITVLGLALAEFRDGVNRRDDLIPAAADAAELSMILVDQLEALDRPAESGPADAAELRGARSRTSVIVGRLERELADRPGLAAAVDEFRDQLLTWQQEPSRAELTSLVADADALTSSIASAVEDVADGAKTSRELFLWSVAGAAIVCVLLLGFGAWALHRWVIVPVRRLAADVSSVAEGDYDRPLTSEGGQELVELAESVRRMRDGILAERDLAVRAVESVDDHAPAVAALRTLLAPREATPPAGLEAAGALLPAEGLLAGDWYDVARRDDELVIVIGDVCGHGVDAGVLAVRTKFALLDAIDVGLEPDAALELAAKRFGRDDTFVTALVAAVDVRTGRLRYASAGHNPALVVRADGSVEQLPRTGPLIGLADGPRPVAETALGPGDLLVAYTDGVVEARDTEGQQWRLESLEPVLLEHVTAEPARIAEVVLAQVLAHCGGRCADDATVVVVRVGA